MKIFQNKVSVLRNVLVGATMVVAASSAFAHENLKVQHLLLMLL
jgi:hypothetical protein